jgi:hypothetical protein
MNTPEKKETLQLSLTSGQAASLIPILQDELREFGTRQTEASGELKKLEKEYIKQKKLTDELTNIVKEKKGLLESILKHTGGTKTVHRLMRSGSHNTGGGFNPDGIRWGREFVNTLKREQRFMTFDELFDDWRKRNNNAPIPEKKISSQKNNLRVGDKQLRERMIEGKKMGGNAIPILIYADKLGLKEWFEQYADGKILPNAKFMKQFMYAQTEERKVS